LLLGGAVCFLIGCSTVPGQGFFGLSQANPLLDQAKILRHSIPQPAPTARELAPELHPPYVLEPGDGLLIETDLDDADLRVPADHTVLPDGTIDLGRYGQLPVAGRTVAEVEAAVHSLVAARLPELRRTDEAAAKPRELNPIDVRLTNRQSKVYYILGEVNSPGAYPLVGNETVLRGLVTAGGLTDRASPDNIIMSRPTPPDGCRVVLPVCYRQIVQLGDTTTNYQLRAGDRVFVPSKGVCEMLGLSKSKGSPCCGPQYGCPAPEPFVTPGPIAHP
jgi:protein involved in polysaccharide export with SLBB domain